MFSGVTGGVHSWLVINNEGSNVGLSMFPLNVQTAFSELVFVVQIAWPHLQPGHQKLKSG